MDFLLFHVAYYVFTYFIAKDLLTWIETTVWPFSAILGAIEKADEHYFIHFCVLGTACLLGLKWGRRSRFFGWHSSSATSQVFDISGSSSTSSSPVSTSSGIRGDALQVNNSVYELYRPLGEASLQIMFLHGLQEENYLDVHLSTWQSGDGSCIWPQTWLVEEFPGAHVLSISYVTYLNLRLDSSNSMELIVERILSDLLDAKVGQASDCPVVLVGHSIGGMIVKQLCHYAHEKLETSNGSERVQLENFLRNMRGIFYYATPHRGIAVAEILGGYLNIPLMDNFKPLSAYIDNLNYKFEEMCNEHYKWLFAGLGESRSTKLGDIEYVIVPESSARYGKDFTMVDGDHLSICRPQTKDSLSFSKLKDFLFQIDEDFKLKQLRDRAASTKGSRGDRPNIDRLQDNDDDDWYEDSITYEIMCDPVNCSDGRTYDRWTIVDNNLRRSPYDRSQTTFTILCDDITTRSRLFRAFPGQETPFRERRMKYREEALQLACANPIEFEEAIEKLSNVVKWHPLDNECQRKLDAVLRLVSQQGCLLNSIPVVNHEDVSGARLESEGVQLVIFFGVCYFTIMFFLSI